MNCVLLRTAAPGGTQEALRISAVDKTRGVLAPLMGPRAFFTPGTWAAGQRLSEAAGLPTPASEALHLSPPPLHLR